MRLLQLIEKTKKGKFGRAQTYRLYMPNGGEDGVLIGWRADWPESHYVEFRGPPYSQWEGKGSDFELVHDALEGRHATVLHTNDVLDVLPTHPRYDLIKNAIDNDAIPPVTRGYAFEDDLLGPHQDKELELMLAGKKPFSLIDTSIMSNREQAGWWHATATGKIIHAIGINAKHKADYFSLPGEEWRMGKARAIYQNVRDTGTMTDKHHTTLGQLLGYSDEAIQYFVSDRPSLRKERVTEEVVPFTKQWAPSDIALTKIWQIVQALIKKGLGDELNGRFDNFLFAIEQYNDLSAQRSQPSELEGLSERHLHQIYEYGKKVHWQPLSRSGFKARQRMIAQSWGKEVTEGLVR